MRKISILILMIPFFLASSAGAAPCTERLGCIPDLTQTDPQARFPYQGVHYCGPCAVSNSIMWLGENGYEKLLPKAREKLQVQADLTRLLASRKYMDTTLEWGTSPADILKGISRYLRDCGYEYADLSYQGWRKIPRRFNTGETRPRLEWIQSGFLGDSAVWLNVGWYVFSPKKNRYMRVGGHWVTLVGFGVDENGRENPDVLIIHDPATLQKHTSGNDYVRLEKIGGGTLVTGSGKMYGATGFFKMAGMEISEDADLGILDGAIRLQMKRPRPPEAAGEKVAGLK